MGNKKTMPAVHLKAKRVEKLNELLHCTIPQTIVKTVVEKRESGTTYVVNPEINADTGNGKKWTPDQTYRDIKNARIKYLKEHFSGKPKTKRKTEWFKLTSGKCYNYETRKQSWGDLTKPFRVPSEVGLFHIKYMPKKFNKSAYIMGVVRDTVKQWEKSNPMPQKTIEGTKNAFYYEEYADWMNNRSQVWNNKLLSFKDRSKHLLSEYLQHTDFHELANAA